MMYWQELQKQLMKRRRKKTITPLSTVAFLTGGALGVTTGLLLAPESGRVTRTRLTTNARRGWDTGWAKMIAAKSAISSKLQRASETMRSQPNNEDEARHSSNTQSAV